jgi:ATP-dependent RNA helicase DDX21
LSNKTAKNVKHLAVYSSWHDRLDALSKILTCYGGNGKIIVFTSTKADANNVYYFANRIVRGGAGVMHGDIPQYQRESTIRAFKEGGLQVLVATDVASRGLDIPHVDLVVQTEPPQDTESYIHRSGRTARAGRSGMCVTLYDSRNEELLIRAEHLAGIRIERVAAPN